MVNFVLDFSHALLRGDAFVANRTSFTVPAVNNIMKK